MGYIRCTADQHYYYSGLICGSSSKVFQSIITCTVSTSTVASILMSCNNLPKSFFKGSNDEASVDREIGGGGGREIRVM